MQRFVLSLALLAGALAAQQGGRDPGTGEAPVVFVRWTRTQESFLVYDAAWNALEPHRITRRRVITFDADEARARSLLRDNADARLVVALDHRAAEAVRSVSPDAPLVEVSPDPASAIDLLVPRDRLAGLLRRFAPAARRVAVWSPRREALPDGFEVLPAGEEQDADLVWIAEGADLAADAWRRCRARHPSAPVVSTHPGFDEAEAALTVRPHPTSAGLRLAALVLRRLRGQAPPARSGPARLHVSVDLRAARRTGHDVPLDLLARADAVRREP